MLHRISGAEKSQSEGVWLGFERSHSQERVPILLGQKTMGFIAQNLCWDKLSTKI